MMSTKFSKKGETIMAIYMKIDGMKGSVTTKGYEGWIEVYSFNNEITRNIQQHRLGQMNNRESSIPSFQDITVTKRPDQATPLLFSQACHGRAIPQIEIHICKTADQITPYRQYVLHNVLLSHYSESAGSGGNPIERIKLSFTKIENSYTPYDANHKAGSPIKSGYDLAQMQKV